MSLFDPAADYALDRLMARVSERDDEIEACWHRTYDGVLVKATPAFGLHSPPDAVDLFIARPGETATEFDERSSYSHYAMSLPDHPTLPKNEVKQYAPLPLDGADDGRVHFERAAQERGTSRDPVVFAAIAADYLRTGPPSADLEHHDQRHLNAMFRGAMDSASSMPTHLETITELLDNLPRDVRSALDFNRSGDADVVKFGAYLAQHRVGPERRALDRFTIEPEREQDHTQVIDRR